MMDPSSASSRHLFLVVFVLGLTIAVMPGTARANSTVTVDCDNPAAQYHTITSALASFTSLTDVNMINVTGTCNQEGTAIRHMGVLVTPLQYTGLQIAAFTQLSITAGVGGANISFYQIPCGTPTNGVNLFANPAVSMTNAVVKLSGPLVISGSGGISLTNSTLTLGGVTVSGSWTSGINVPTGSSVTLQGHFGSNSNVTPNTISYNCGQGINAGGSVSILAQNYIGYNGTQGLNVNGVANLNTAAGLPGQITIEQNGGTGVTVGGNVSFNATADATGQLLIQNNAAAGVQVRGGTANFNGQTIVQGNGAGGPGIFILGGINASAGARINVNTDGLQVVGNNGIGINVDIQSSALLGPATGTGANITVSGNTGGGMLLNHLSLAQSWAGTTMSNNTGYDVNCGDGSSIFFGVTTGIAKTTACGAPK